MIIDLKSGDYSLIKDHTFIEFLTGATDTYFQVVLLFILPFFSVLHLFPTMAIGVVEFSNGGYKFGKVFA